MEEGPKGHPVPVKGLSHQRVTYHLSPNTSQERKREHRHCVSWTAQHYCRITAAEKMLNTEAEELRMLYVQQNE
eukprot:scaffold15816_cov70-Cyclotella_meneghiniana.AAC.11